MRATGADLREAKKAYQDFLPVLQPIGQEMLNRAISALDQIKEGLNLPLGYAFTDTGYRSRRFAQFEAGQFQLNEDASLYIRREVGGQGSDEDFGAEIRVFTHKVKAFVPAWIGKGSISGQQIDLFGDSPFLKTDSYAALADQIINAMQVKMDSILPASPAVIADAEEDEPEGMRP